MRLGKVGKGLLVVLVIYVGAYAWMRYTGALVRSQAGGNPPKQVIAAKAEAAPAEVKATEEADAAELTRSRGAVGETKVTLLNSIFWPLCTAEAAYWNWKGS